MIEDGTYVPQTAPAAKAADLVWGKWYKTDNTDWSKWVPDENAWAQYLPQLGFKGDIGYQDVHPDYGTGNWVYTPEAQKEISRLEASGYKPLTRLGTHNIYSALKTPDGTWQLNQKGQSFLEEMAPVLGLLAAPLSGGLSGLLAPAIGTTAASIVAPALISGGLSAASGGDFLKGAIKGGLTAGIGSLVSPIASSIGADVLSSTDSQALADAATGAIKSGAGALASGDLKNVVSSALTGGATSGVASGLSNATGLAPKDINNAIKAVQNLDDPLALIGIASSYLPGPNMPGAGTTESVEDIKDFFGPGKPGFMPTEYLDDEEVQRELTSLLSRAPAPATPSDWFLGENIMSGVPEWDISGVNAGLPIGNLEQDFYVEQAKEGPRIVDSAGNVGTFVNGEFVVDTGVTPDLSYLGSITPPAPASGPSVKSTPAPAAPAATKKQDDLDLLKRMMMFGGMMGQQKETSDPYQVAQINTRSPFGMDLLI